MRRIQADGVELSVAVEGPEDAPAVLLLHGFPDSSALWRHQVPALVGAGLRVIAPDLRGFGASDKPEPVEDYRLGRSVADAVAVLDALGVERAHVVGHDFGAVVAWLLAAIQPARVDRLAALSVGHPDTRIMGAIEQREKSWYMLFFQFEGVAEELLRRDDWRLMREWLRGEGDVERYLEHLAEPGALTAGLNWYRANTHPAAQLADRPPLPPVQAPTLGLWSTGDRYLLEDGMARSGAFVDGGWRYERIERASHWLQLDQPDRVNALLLEHLASG